MNSATVIWSSRIIAFFNVVVVMCSIAITWTFMTQSFSFATLFDSLVDFDPWGWWSSKVASEASTSYDWFHYCLLPQQHHKFCICWVGSSSPHHTHYPNKGIFKHQPIVNEGKITFWIFSLYKSKVFLQSFFKILVLNVQSVWIDWKLRMNLASLKALCVAIVVIQHHPKYRMPLIRTCILLQIGSQWKRLNKSLLLFYLVEQTIKWTTWQSPFNVTIINTFLANGRDLQKLPIYGTIVISSSYPPPQMTINDHNMEYGSIHANRSQPHPFWSLI